MECFLGLVLSWIWHLTCLLQFLTWPCLPCVRMKTSSGAKGKKKLIMLFHLIALSWKKPNQKVLRVVIPSFWWNPRASQLRGTKRRRRKGRYVQHVPIFSLVSFIFSHVNWNCKTSHIPSCKMRSIICTTTACRKFHVHLYLINYILYTISISILYLKMPKQVPPFLPGLHNLGAKEVIFII
jgi:hypothetical protein